MLSACAFEASMKVIRKVDLIKTNGFRGLRLELSLCEQSAGRFVVNYRQELADGTFYDSSLTVYPVSLAEAEHIFDRTLSNKLTWEGYQQLQPIHPLLMVSPSDVSTPPPTSWSTSSTHAASSPTAVPSETSRESSRTSPEERKKRARRRRYERQILVDLQLCTGNKRSTADPEPGWLCWRAGLLQLREAELALLVLARSAVPARAAAAVWALGRCGTQQAIPTLRALHAEKNHPEQVRWAAAEALLALSREEARAEFRAALRGTLPQELQALSFESDPKAFQLALSSYLTRGTAEAHDVVSLLYQIGDPVSRPALLGYIRSVPLAPPGFRQIRKLMKAAEFRRDAEVFGLIAYRLETTKETFSSPRWGDPFQEELASGKRAYGSRTRTYLRRRVWRLLRSLGSVGDEDFVPMAVGVLLPFSDSDGRKPYQIDRYDHEQKRVVSIEYSPFASFYAFNKLLYRHSERVLEANRLLHRTRGECSLQKIPRAPREEAFPELWRARPEGLLHLLDESRCSLIHEFAALALADCKAFCDQMSPDMLRMLLGKPYEPTAKLGFELVARRYKPEQPDLDLLAATATCIYAPARQQALQWLTSHERLLAQHTSALATMLLSRYADVQQAAEKILERAQLPESSLQTLLMRVIVGLLAFGSGDEEQAARVRSLLVKHLGSCLGILPEGVVQDLLRHPLAEVQAVGGEALILAATTPSDERIENLLASPHEIVRRTGTRLLEKLPDAALLQRSLLLARLLAHVQPDLRSAGLQLSRRLAEAYPPFRERLCELLVDALLRHKLSQGAADFLFRVLSEDWKPALVNLPAKRITRMLRSNNRQAQELGARLVLEHDLADAFEIDDLTQLCDQETLAVRKIGWQLLEANLARVKADMAGAIRVLDSPWEDTRAWAFRFFREQLSGEDFTLDVLVAIHDSVRPDVQAFGREMLELHFREEEGPTLMLRLSEHPSPAAHLLVTNYLDRFAAGNASYIRGLMPYFCTVLGQVNRGRVARLRVIDFLRREAIASEEVAEEIIPLLYRTTASIAIETRALALEALAAIGRAHPSLKLPIMKIAPEVRHGVSLCILRYFRDRESWGSHFDVLRPRRESGAYLLFGRAGPGSELPGGDQCPSRRSHKRPALPTERQDCLPRVGSTAGRARAPADPSVAQRNCREDQKALRGAGGAPTALSRAAAWLREGKTRILPLPLPARLQRVVGPRPGDHGTPGRNLLRVLQPGRVHLRTYGPRLRNVQEHRGACLRNNQHRLLGRALPRVSEDP
ncbi:MAG: hypothetical protein NZX77_06990 [Polyangiaceae bacterium]|nr:hypothetical protein [Polyangiaceae bacterium]